MGRTDDAELGARPDGWRVRSGQQPGSSGRERRMYEGVKVEFRTELHARWSVFFDHLRVPWAYEPVTFYDSQGSPRTPAFWLPEQRIWFAAELEAPVWWGRFAMAAEGSDYWSGGWGEEADSCLPVEVPEEWKGRTLLAEGPFFPDDTPGINSWGQPAPWRGPWRFHEALGMCTYNDAPYQWTMCPQCGSFGAEFWGYAERLRCGCLDDREHRKVVNSSDERLLAAYRAAQLEQWHADFTDLHATVLRPTVREALVHQPGAAAAREVRGRVPVTRRAAAPGTVARGGWGGQRGLGDAVFGVPGVRVRAVRRTAGSCGRCCVPDVRAGRPAH